MLFNSLTFLVFLTVMTVLFWVTSSKTRMVVLFIGSLTFYGFWRWDFVLLMLFSTIVDWSVSNALEKTTEKGKRKLLLLTSLVINLGLLVVFKYLLFITLNINSIAELIHVNFRIQPFHLILPLGISFYTFQTISYTIDVYRNHQIPEKNFFKFGTFVTFFPQLVAGPILRAGEVMDKLSHNKKFSITYITNGLERIFSGLFLKVVLADNIAPLVDAGFAHDMAAMTALDVVALAFLFGFQIYFDFAGYSHIAIGCAKLMAIDFPENFNFPYFASSLKEFWKKWHISLSSWIRDYLYLPILGIKVKDRQSNSEGGLEVLKSKKSRNPTFALFTTWAIMGLWHGANWTFVFWGVYHAFFVYLERLIKKMPVLQKLRRPFIGWLLVLPVSMLSWIPFRAQSLQDTLTMYASLFHFSGYTHYSLRENDFLIVAVLFLCLTATYLLSRLRISENTWLHNLNLVFQPLKIAVMVYFVIIFLRPISQFIYFQF